MNAYNNKLRSAKIPFLLNPVLVLLVIALTSFGLLMIYSTTAVIAEKSFGNEHYYFFKQFVAVIIGIFFMMILSRVSIKNIYKISSYMFFVSIFLLILPMIPHIGSGAGGAKRWVELGVFRFQPGEFVKIFFIVYLAGFYARHESDLQKFSVGLFRPLILVAIIGVLFLLQPDFGSLAIIVGATFVMAVSVGVAIRYFFVGLFTILPIITLLICTSPYRMKRIEAFLFPFKDTSGKAYQLVQSLIAIGGGKLFGVGLGNSKQKLHFLPAAHTDFIFSVIAEELGFLGGVFIILAFFFLFLKCLNISAKVFNKTFPFALSVGLTALIIVPAFLNFGIVMGVLPTKGLVLPFIGFGGSNIVATFMVIGLLLAIVRSTYKQDF